MCMCMQHTCVRDCNHSRRRRRAAAELLLLLLPPRRRRPHSCYCCCRCSPPQVPSQTAMPTRPRLAAALAAVGLVLVLLLVPAVLSFRPISARDASLMTGQCHMLNGLTEVVLAILMYRLGSKLIREHLLPLWFAMLHVSQMHGDAETLEERRWIAKIS